MLLSSRALTRPHRTFLVLLSCALALATVAITSSAAGATVTSIPMPATVTLTASATSAAASATWSPVTSVPVDGYVVQLLMDGNIVGRVTCPTADCTSRQFRGLTAGHSYQVGVYAFSGLTAGTWNVSPAVRVGSGCASGVTYCLAVDATSDGGTVARAAQGYLLSNGAGLNSSRAASLKPRWWRVRVINGDYSGFDAATSSGAQVVLLLSDAWLVDTYTSARGGALAPWSSWDTYRTWVRTYVATLVATGRTPAYWDVQNEPGGGTYLNAADTVNWTADNQLQQWQIAYEEIRAQLPDAKVIGPSTARFIESPLFAGPTELALSTFVNYASAHGLQPGAISWHELGGATAGDYNAQPDNVLDHIAAARRMLANAHLNRVEVRVDEFAGGIDGPLPGWLVGWFAGLDNAQVDGAIHSCFPFANGSATVDACETPSLDNAVDPNTQATRGTYWVQSAYSQMTGRRLTATTSHTTVSALAAYGTDGIIRILAGRHQDCRPLTNSACPMSEHTTPSAVDMPLRVTVPSTSPAWRVVVQRVPFSTGSVAAPTTVSDAVMTPSAGVVNVTLPSVADGDSLTITLTPAAAPAPPPSGTNPLIRLPKL